MLENVNLLLLRAQALLSDRNLGNIEQLIGNLTSLTTAIAENRGNVEKLIADAAATMENLREATGSLESMAGSLQTNVETLSKRADSTRSEEHTSELQSLMRNPYAVFCLKQKKKYQQKQ